MSAVGGDLECPGPLIALMALVMPCAAAGPPRRRGILSRQTIRLIVPSDVGGGYDLMPDLFATHFRRHVPREPAIWCRNSGPAVACWRPIGCSNIAPKMVWLWPLSAWRAVLFRSSATRTRSFPDQVQLARSFKRPKSARTTLFHSAKAQTMADAFKDSIVLGGSGPNDSETYPYLMNTRSEPGSRRVWLGPTLPLFWRWSAASRRRYRSWSIGEVGAAAWVGDSRLRVLVQFARTRASDLPEVPLVTDLGENHGSMWNVILAMARFGRPVTAPPGIAPELTKAMPQGLHGTVADPAFVAEMSAGGASCRPRTAKHAAPADEVAATPPETLTKAHRLTRRASRVRGNLLRRSPRRRGPITAVFQPNDDTSETNSSR